MITAGGVSDSSLKLGYWYLTHKELLRKLFIYLMFFANLNLLIFAIYSVAQTYYFDKPFYVEAITQHGDSWGNYSTFNQANQPLEPRVSTIKIFKNIGSTYDLMVTVRNDNQIWAGQVIGKFQIGENVYEDKVFNILPNSSRVIAEIGVSSSIGSIPPQFFIESINWERVSNKDDFDRLIHEGANFVINNIKYSSPSELRLGTQVPISGVSFDIENNSLFDYWTVDTQVLFKRGSEIVAINVINLEEFRSGQFRVVDFRVFGNLSGITSVEVQPYIDIYDKYNVIEEPFMLGEEK